MSKRFDERIAGAALIGAALLVILSVFAVCETGPPSQGKEEVRVSSPGNKGERAVEIVQEDISGERTLSASSEEVQDEPLQDVMGCVLSGRVVDSHGTHLIEVRSVTVHDLKSDSSLIVPVKDGLFEAVLQPGIYVALVPDRFVPEGVLPQLPLSAHQERGNLVESPLLPNLVEILPEQLSASVVVTLLRPCSVSGRVIDVHGNAVENAFVRVQSSLPGMQSLAFDRMTDGEGAFEIEGVRPNARYGVLVVVSEATDPAQRTLAPPAPLPIEVFEGQALDLPDLVVGAGRTTVRGKVVDQEGLPFGGLRVLCYDGGSPEFETGFGMLATYGAVYTNERGEFEFYGLPACLLNLQLAGDYEPKIPLGKRISAFWEPPIEVNAATGAGLFELGTFQVDRSRPFFFTLEIVPEPGVERVGDCLVQVDFLEQSNGWDWREERRPPFQPMSWDFRHGDEPIVWSCETPLPTVLFKVYQNNIEVRRFEIHPFPNGTARKELAVGGN